VAQAVAQPSLFPRPKEAPMSTENPIRNVSDTALWVAICRARESERPDAIFDDPYARRLGGERGEAILHGMPGGASTAWPIVVRSAVMDEIVANCIREGARTVLNLAAGLDARPYRMSLPAELRWIHVDMPEMVDYFREGMAGETPRCRLEFVAADLRDAEVRRKVFADAATEGPVLVITEGLLIYLTADDVAPLARDLHEIVRARWWLSDLASPTLLRMMGRRWERRLEAGNSPFRFAPADGTAHFRPFGWREIEWRSTWTESLRLGRTMRFAWILNLLGKLRSKQKRAEALRISGIMLLGPDH
jgi:methyltransferase (TIGR00027 family)